VNPYNCLRCTNSSARFIKFAVTAYVGCNALACEIPPDSKFPTDDNENIVHVDTSGIDVYDVVPTPFARVGGNVAAEEAQLHIVIGATRITSRNEIVIAVQGPKEVRIYDSAGVFRRSMGRSGDGPGEFRGMRSLSLLAGDTIAVYDFGLDRISYFSASGKFERVISHSDAQVTRTAWVAPGGQIIRQHLSPNRLTEHDDGIFIDSVTLSLSDRDGNLIAKLDDVGGGEYIKYRGNSALRPLGQALYVGVGRTGFYIGSGRGLIAAYDYRGSPGKLLSLPYRQIITRNSEYAAAVDNFLLRIAPSGKAWMKAQFAAFDPPTYLPNYTKLLVDAEDNLWVANYSESGNELREWWVVDVAAEKVVASVSVPRAWNILAVGLQGLLVHDFDDDDIESVALHKLRLRKESNLLTTQPSNGINH
jgi:hypothetical protein